MQKTSSQLPFQPTRTLAGYPKRNRFRQFIMLITAFCILLSSASLLYLRQPQFASPVVVARTYNAPYDAGVFHNTVPAPVLANSDNLLIAWFKFLTDKIPEATPDFALPSEQTDLHALDKESNLIVWMGHSSYFIQLDGVRFLVDPVFSDNASPVPYTNLAFEGSNIYQAEDIPEVDYLLITHDHWDHLDYPSVVAVRERVAQAITPIGVGSYLTQWGYDANRVFEGDWYDRFEQGPLQIHMLPAQHFSGRLFKRNQTLWGSFALIMPNHKVYIGGDSGYGDHFKQIHARLGAFDVAILEAGQYNENWRHIHMMPEETVQAALDLQAKAMLPAHNSKFKLSKHAWYEPLERISELSDDINVRLMTPIIGQVMWLDDEQQSYEKWWQQ